MKNFLFVTLLAASSLTNCDYKYKTYKLEDTQFAPINKEESYVYNNFDLSEISWARDFNLDREEDCPVTPPSTPPNTTDPRCTTPPLDSEK